MSYCRWSSEDFSCDLYCYENVAGCWTTHVAGNRIVGDIPKVDHLFKHETIAEYVEATKNRSKFFETAIREPIRLPYAGQTFNDATLEKFLERLIHLRETGYRFPDHVLETVREEIAEAAEQETM